MIHVNHDWRKKLTHPAGLVEWAASRPEASFYDLWDANIEPRWFPYLAVAGGATSQQLVLAACAVARLWLTVWQRLAIELRGVGR